MNDSAPRQAGWQTLRVPTHARTVLVRLDEHKMEVWLAFYDGGKWRSLNRGYFKFPVTGWMEISEVAHFLDAIGNPTA